MIVTHRLYTGAGQDLYRYLKNNNSSVLLVEHSFASYPDRRTVFSFFDGKNESKKSGINFRFLPDILCYIKDFCYSFYAAARFPYRYKRYFGCGGFNVIPALILRALGRVDKVIFYTIDFAPRRFKNSILNLLYRFIDQIAVTFADEIWNVSERISQARENFSKIPKRISRKQKCVPIGIWIENLPRERTQARSLKNLVFCGDLTEGQGVQLVLQAIPEIVRHLNDFKFTVIGDGDYLCILKEMSRELGIEKFVDFTGPIYDSASLLKRLCLFRIAVAPYLGDELSTAYFADQTKPKTYFSCSLPVVITKLPWIHELVEQRNLGLVIDYNKSQMASAVVRLMNDDKLYQECRKNIESFISELDWSKIFENALTGKI
ncbi:glycosyltransferase [Candidatus Omnitrophota bacterium]